MVQRRVRRVHAQQPSLSYLGRRSERREPWESWFTAFRNFAHHVSSTATLRLRWHFLDKDKISDEVLVRKSPELCSLKWRLKPLSIKGFSLFLSSSSCLCEGAIRITVLDLPPARSEIYSRQRIQVLVQSRGCSTARRAEFQQDEQAIKPGRALQRTPFPRRGHRRLRTSRGNLRHNIVIIIDTII